MVGNQAVCILLKCCLVNYRPKRSFGQGNIFTPVCHSVHGGGVCSKFSGGVSAPNFRGGVCSKFWGGLLQILGGSAPNFLGGVCSKFSGGVSAPNFREGGVCSKFSGGCLLQIFWGGFKFSEYGHRSAGTHPTGMHSCFKINWTRTLVIFIA